MSRFFYARTNRFVVLYYIFNCCNLQHPKPEIDMLLSLFNIVNVGVTIICFSFIVLIFAAVKWYRHINEFKKR